MKKKTEKKLVLKKETLQKADASLLQQAQGGLREPDGEAANFVVGWTVNTAC